MHDSRNKFSYINATSVASGKLKDFIPVTEGGTWATVGNMTDRVSAGNAQQQPGPQTSSCKSCSVNADNTRENMLKEKDEILPWRHKLLLVRTFKHKTTIPVLHSMVMAALQEPSQAVRLSWHTVWPCPSVPAWPQLTEMWLKTRVFSPAHSWLQGKADCPVPVTWLGTENASLVLVPLLGFV